MEPKAWTDGVHDNSDIANLSHAYEKIIEIVVYHDIINHESKAWRFCILSKNQNVESGFFYAKPKVWKNPILQYEKKSCFKDVIIVLT